MMKSAIIAAAVVAIVYASYTTGWQAAVKGAPEYEAIKAASAAADQAFWAMIEAEKTDRDRLCESLFEDMQDILDSERMHDVPPEMPDH